MNKKYIYAGVAVAILAVSVLLISQQLTRSSLVEADELVGLTPQQAFSAALENMQNAKTGSFSSQILLEPVMEAGTSTKQPDSLTAHYSGSVDATDPTSPKLMFAFDATIPKETGMPEGVSGTIDAEARAFKTSVYVKLNQMPGIMDFTPILKTWIKIDLTDITKQLGISSKTKEIDPALVAQFRTDFNNADIIKINQTYADAKVNGVSTGHYGWIVDKKAVIAFIPKYQAFIKSVGASGSAQTVAMDKMMAQAVIQLATIPAEEYPSGDIWITKSNPTIAEIKFEKTISVPAASTASTPGVTGARVVMTLFFTDMNKPVSITEPTTSITFQEAYDKLMKSPPGTGTADLFAQSRDSQRISDLGSLKGALSLYLTTANKPVLCTDKNTVYRSDKGTNAVDATGWLPVDLTKIKGGAPIAQLPKDPTNTGSFVYSYACDQTNLTFEFNANIESARYSKGGKDDVESTDGGNNTSIYETGTAPGLKLITN